MADPTREQTSDIRPSPPGIGPPNLANGTRRRVLLTTEDAVFAEAPAPPTVNLDKTVWFADPAAVALKADR